MVRNLKNVAASVHDRLLNKARKTSRRFDELLQYYAMERFLYRLSRSRHSGKFVLKGALMFKVWKAPVSRPTKDIDFLGNMENSVDSVVSIVKEICTQEVEQDGIVFDAGSISGERIVEAADYEGVRVRFRGGLGTARITMQIDVGFGDVVTPSPSQIDYPVVLDFPAPRLRGYSKESVVAEKLESMVKLGMLNSRMKDFYDIWYLCHYFDFDGPILTQAVIQTFSRRGTEIPSVPVALTNAFAEDSSKINQWQSFLRRNQLEDVPDRLAEMIAMLAELLLPVVKAANNNRLLSKIWIAPGPWSCTSRTT